jgi:flavodoxin/NAD-dependent dihydropyrimidine dehydrogenase PreA subunit
MIFYFTATGNSKFIAERIASKTNDRTINITECIQTGDFEFEIGDDEALGFVVPVYAMGVPIIVTEFLEKMNIQLKPDSYVFAVLNCGGITGDAGRFIKKHMNVNAIFGVKTVDNYVPMSKMISEAEIVERLNKAETDIDEIIKLIEKKAAGDFNNVKGVFPRLVTSMFYPVFKTSMKTIKFTVNNDCNNCELCTKVCPRNIIRMVDGKPVWEKPQCEVCLACLHRCPKSAINYGKKTAKNGRFLNNRVSL